MFPTLSQPDSVKKYAVSAAAEERQPAGTSSAGRGLTNGTLVHFWSNADHPTTEDAQKWYLIANGDGTFKIKR